jgi:hypothetical protein
MTAFHPDHYFKVFKAHDRKEMYCFALGTWLGENGLYRDHPLKGEIITRKRSNKPYTVTNVYVHYYDGGYYFVALCDDENKSTGQLTWNINSPKPKIVCNSHLWNVDIIGTNIRPKAL